MRNEPVTIIFGWEVKPDKKDAFLKWAHATSQAAAKWPGHMGVTNLQPPDGKGSYHSIVRFDTARHLEDWMT